ncbi:MAG: hypothetical protein AAF799_39460 [Myxococcota bacterium]
MTAANCEDLTRSAAALTAFTLDPAVVGGQSAEPPPDEPSNEPPGPSDEASIAEPPEPSEPEPEPEPTPPKSTEAQRRAFAVTIHLHGGASIQALPSTAPVVGGGVGLQWERLRIELDAVHAIRRELAVEDHRARVDLTLAALRGCGVFHERSVEFPVCAGFEAGALRGAPEPGSIGTSSGNIPWLAIDFGLGLRWVPWSFGAVRLDLQPWLRLSDSTYTFEESGSSEEFPPWSPGRFGLRFLLGIEFRV